MIHILLCKYHLSSAVLLKYPHLRSYRHQYDDLICIFNRRNSLCDNNLCCIRDLLAESLTYQGICSCIYCTGRVIQDQDLRFLEKSPCNTQTLLLTAGYVVTALNDHCIVAIRELTDESICLGQLTDPPNFFLTGMFITPANIVIDAS